MHHSCRASQLDVPQTPQPPSREARQHTLRKLRLDVLRREPGISKAFKHAIERELEALERMAFLTGAADTHLGEEVDAR